MSAKLNSSAKFSRTESHHDWYDWAVYVDEDTEKLDAIDQVTYFLDQNFANPVRTITDKSSGFAMTNSGWGQIDVKARISYKDGHSEQTTYRLDLPKVKQATGSFVVNIYDGTRQPMAASTPILVRIRDGNQKELVSDFFPGPSIKFDNLPIYNSFGDNYAVWLSAPGYVNAGFYPVKVAARVLQSIDVMLLPKNGSFNFRDALWATLKLTHPKFAAILAQGASADPAANDVLQTADNALHDGWRPHDDSPHQTFVFADSVSLNRKRCGNWH